MFDIWTTMKASVWFKCTCWWKLPWTVRSFSWLWHHEPIFFAELRANSQVAEKRSKVRENVAAVTSCRGTGLVRRAASCRRSGSPWRSSRNCSLEFQQQQQQQQQLGNNCHSTNTNTAQTANTRGPTSVVSLHRFSHKCGFFRTDTGSFGPGSKSELIQMWLSLCLRLVTITKHLR